METCILPSSPQPMVKLCSAKTPAMPCMFLLQTLTPEGLNANPVFCMAQRVRLSVNVDWQIFADWNVPQEEGNLVITKPVLVSYGLP